MTFFSLKIVCVLDLSESVFFLVT